MLSLEDAKKLFTPKSKQKLNDTVNHDRPVINSTNKVNNDIVMQALCRAVDDNTIRVDDLDDRLVKLLNSNTNTISYHKLISALKVIRKSNHNIACVIEIRDPNTINQALIKDWVITGEKDSATFVEIFEYVCNKFEITPHMIREKMTETLKATVVNNVAQLLAKFDNATEEERKDFVISIRTITRLVCMSGYLIYAEFKKIK